MTVPLISVAKLINERVGPFVGERRYLATGSVADDGSLDPALVTWDERPTRADLEVQIGDLCFARMKETRKVRLFHSGEEDCILSTGFAIVRPDPALLDGRFLLHVLRSDDFQRQKDSFSHGATQQAITNTGIRKLQIPLPPLGEQRRIAAILDKADEVRAERQGSLKTLDYLSQAIFHDIIGDPISNTHQWPTKTLDELMHFCTGKLDSNAAVEGGKYPFFTCAKDTLLIDEYAFDCEALLLAGNNATGDYSVKHYNGRFNAYQRTYVITLKSESDSYEYIRMALQQSLQHLKRISKGTNTKYLTLALLNNVSILYPPPEIQYKYEERIDAVKACSISAAKSQAMIHDLHTALQTNAFQGTL